MAQPKNARRLEYLSLDEVKPAKRNPKRHDDASLDASLDRFGFTEPVLLDERTGRLVAGHGRLERLRQAQARGDTAPEGIQVLRDGTWKIPVIRGWASRNDAEAEAYLVASNRIVETGGWDLPELADLLGSIRETDLGLDGIGYDPASLDELLESLVSPEPEPEPIDDEPIEPPTKPVTRAGDVWLLGPHRLICGSSRDPGTVARLLDGAAINLAFTSPPYADRRTYDETTEFRPIPPDEYVEWFAPVAAIVADHLASDGSWLVNLKEGATDGRRELYVKDLTLAHARLWGWWLVDEFCWHRGGMPGHFPNRFRNEWEPIFHFTRGAGHKHRPENVQVPSDHVRVWNPATWMGFTPDAGFSLRTGNSPEKMSGLANPGNVLRIPGGADKGDGGEHPAAFPSALPEWFIRALTDEGDTVYDPFMGSGSTFLAAHRQNRIGYGVEISPRYCDVICARFERHTGIVPVLERTGKPRSFAPRA